jgi:hypothetical protein
MASADTITVSAERITGTTAALPNIQSFTLTSGRTNIDDNYRAGRATLVGRVPSSLPTLEIDNYVSVALAVSSSLGPGPSIAYELRVTNLKIDYGIVPAEDTWTLELEDAFGLLGRALVSLSVSAGTLTTSAAEDVCDEVPDVTFFTVGTATTTKVNAQTFDNANALDAFQTYANTEWAYVLANGNGIRWFARNAWVDNAQVVTFADDGTGDLEFQTLTFNTLADATADRVVIKVRGGAEYTAGTGSVGLQLDSYSETATDAQNLADYVLAVFSSTEPRPFQLSYMLNFQDDTSLLVPIDPNFPKQVELDFRGGTYTAFVLGFTLSANPDMCRATLNLLPAQSVDFFILDSSTFGVLDTNKLGF